MEYVVLGTAQDAGAPQIGNDQDKGWRDASRRLMVSTGACRSPNGARYIFDPSPDLTEQGHERPRDGYAAGQMFCDDMLVIGAGAPLLMADGHQPARFCCASK